MRHVACTLLSVTALLAVVTPSARGQCDPVFPGRLLWIAPGDGTPVSDLMVAADVDLDGLPDLLTLAYPPGHIDELCVSRGLQGGGFAAPDIWLVPDCGTYDLEAADVNGNGWPDVVSCGNHQVRIAYGTGGGSFAFSASYFVGDKALTGVDVVDVDHDGRLDLLSSGSDLSTGGAIYVNLADGTGGFLPAQEWPAGDEASCLVTADLDEDGWVDAVTVSEYADALQVVLGDGAGGFLPPQVQPLLDGPIPSVLLLGQLNGDGHVDALVISDHRVLTFLNDGAGGLLPVAAAHPYADADGGLLHDSDQDGDLDLLAISDYEMAVTVYVNDGHGAMTHGDGLAVEAVGETGVVIDATGDGLDDLLIHPIDATVAMLPAAPDGSLPDAKSKIIGADAVRCLDAADLDGDGWPDVVYANAAPKSSGTLLGSPDGFAGSVPLSGLEMPYAVALADLTGDGLLDAAVVDAPGAAYVKVLPGLGNGGFGTPHLAPFSTAGATPLAAELADLDGDGWFDILTASGGPVSRLDRFLNLGAAQPGQPGAVQSWSTAPWAEGFDLGDLDGDGVPDAVVSRRPAAAGLPSTLAVLAGDGKGSLLPLVAFDLAAAASDALRVRLGDMNLDGRLDALVSFEDGALVLAAGDGAGALLPGVLLPAVSGGARLAVGDVDGDGWPDAVHTGDAVGSDLVVRRGDGAGGLREPERHSNVVALVDCVLTDMNRDGRPDLVVADHFPVSGTGRVRILDNVRHTFTWTDLQHAKAGPLGEPRLTGAGTLGYGTPGALHLAHAAPLSPALLFAGLTEQPTPFKGGVLVPVPPLGIVGLATDGEGRALLPWAVWPGDEPGLTLVLQAAIADPGAPQHVTLSNALRAVQPD